MTLLNVDYAWSAVYNLIRQSSTLALASLATLIVFSYYPLNRIGEHEFLIPNYKNNTFRFVSLRRWQCMLGYDSSLGSMHPVFVRSMIYVVVYMLLQCMLIILGVFWAEGREFGCGMMILFGDDAEDLVWLCRNLAAVVMLGVVLMQYRASLFVSHPGGAREHKIRRLPKWEARRSELDANVQNRWRCAVAEDSHAVTLYDHYRVKQEEGEESGVQWLTGEPAGRQIWTCKDKIKNETTVCGTPTKNKSAIKSASKSPVQVWIEDKLSFGSKEIESSRVDEGYVQLLASGGREYTGFDPSKNPNSCDRIFRAQQIRNALKAGELEPPSLNSVPTNAKEAAKKGFQFYSMLQTDDGHWAGDYGGPHFLMPGIIIAWYVMGKPDKLLDKNQRELMLHYLSVHQQSDGGWGTHIESPSTMFGTVLCYVSMRLLGADPECDKCQKAQKFMKNEGGALYTSSWSKFWLCLLGCMEWEGHNSVPPEMWLLPNWFPFHPGRLWCHCRMVYLPMGYLYGSRFVYPNANNDPLITSLRKELYCEKYEEINWTTTRHYVAEMDNYSPLPILMKVAQNALAVYENLPLIQPFKRLIRKAGLDFCVEYMMAEDLQTNYIDIGPVNKALNMVSAYHVAGYDISDVSVQKHMLRVPDYLWVAEDGMKMQGYNGSQCWDTSFAIQAMSECNLLDEFPSTSSKVWAYLERTQILSTEVSRDSPAFGYESAYNRNLFYRHVSKGGWPFSTSAHGWPISDCTGEGLKAVLCLKKNSKIITNGIDEGLLTCISDERLFDAVNVMLTLQNEDGGWATYENNRGFGWYEQLNPSEVFGDIMIDYSYVECSMATLTGLAEFHHQYPFHKTMEIATAIKRGSDFIKRIQRQDGSWYGSWACCFCYGCWFGIEGLVTAGESTECPEIKKCCEFLLCHQRSNGGWGEDFTSCYDKDYAENGMDAYGDNGSGVVSTAWALLALSMAKCDDVEAVRRGVKYLMRRQLPSGDWPQEGISGVFNRACGITYTAYRNVFPLWALGRCAETYGDVIN